MKTSDDLQLRLEFSGQDQAPLLLSRPLEKELYEPVHSSLLKWWIPQEDIREYVLEITANQGRRQTGGMWTRPDIVCVGATAFPFVPGRSLEVTTFEIKKTIEEAVEGVYETAAHSAFAHRSFLVVQLPHAMSKKDDEDWSRVLKESKRFGLGVTTLMDASNWQTYEIAVDAEFRNPGPAQINRFIATQLSDEGRQRLLTMFK